MLANLGHFRVADNLEERSSIPDTSVKDCSERITEQSHRVSSKWQKMMAPHFYGSSPLLPTCRAGSVLKKSDSSVISATYDSKIRQVIIFRMVFDSDKYSLQIESSSVSNAEMTEVKPANLGCFGVADQLAEQISVPDKSVKDCSERITEQSLRLTSKWHKMVAAHFYGSSPLLPTCGAVGIPKNRLFQS